MLNTARQHFYA